MLVASFSVIGSAVAKERPRIGANGSVYTPGKTARYETVIGAAAITAMGNQLPLTGPVRLVITEYRTPPESWSKKRKESAYAGEILPTSKPDLDNVAKTIKDGLNEICYTDDAQVCALTISKRYGHESQVNVEVHSW